LHFAWFAEPGAFWTSPENERWRAASLELLEGFVAAGGRRAVVAGSCAEYEWGGDERCSETATPLRPATAYGGSELALWRRAARLEQLSLGWGLIFFVFGPGEHPQRLVSSVARALLRGDPAETSTGEQVRDFIYAPELADA